MTDPDNILDSVVLTVEAAGAWRQACKQAVMELARQGVKFSPDEIGEEQAFAQPDGTLVIQAKLGAYTLHLSLPAKEWSMAN